MVSKDMALLRLVAWFCRKTIKVFLNQVIDLLFKTFPSTQIICHLQLALMHNLCCAFWLKCSLVLLLYIDGLDSWRIWCSIQCAFAFLQQRPGLLLEVMYFAQIERET